MTNSPAPGICDFAVLAIYVVLLAESIRDLAQTGELPWRAWCEIHIRPGAATERKIELWT